jgi:3-phosphoshikimate 1-carboxyvinyltransferase
MIDGLRALGIDIRAEEADLIIDSANGLDGTGARIWAGASGTTARFLTAVAALCRTDVHIDGEERLRNRPLAPLIHALRAMGALVDRDALPIVIDGSALAGGTVSVDASSSSQFVSAIAMIAPALDEGLSVSWSRLASKPFVEATVQVMGVFGVASSLEPGSLEVSTGQGYAPRDFSVPPDVALAVYPALAAAVTGGSVTIRGVVRDRLQPDLMVFDVLERMGCTVDWRPEGVSIQGPTELTAVDAEMGDAPDGALVVAVAAGFAVGTSRISGLSTLAFKESDRFAGIVTGLRTLGARVDRRDDAVVVTSRIRHGGVVDAHDDHRMAMVFSVAGLAQEGTTVTGDESVTKTWPGFYRDMAVLVGGDWAVEATWPTARVPDAMDVIAIDGPGGAGKTTVAEALATALGVAHLDTGAFYRAITLDALRHGAQGEALEDLARVIDVRYEGGNVSIASEDVSGEIRSDDVNRYVSEVSANPSVRREMVRRQQEWVAAHGGRAVVEGRDIGTVVFPNAQLKVFLVARPEVRAYRRAAEMQHTGVDSVQQALIRRDELDSSREVSPLTPAEDAVVIDTSDLTVEQVVAKIVAML